MPKHSKHNTGSSTFTYMERQRLRRTQKWGVIEGRVGSDSQKNFEQCSLCLSLAKNPVCCLKGRIFCKQCLFESFLHQKKENKDKISVYEQEKEKSKLSETLKLNNNNNNQPKITITTTNTNINDNNKNNLSTNDKNKSINIINTNNKEEDLKKEDEKEEEYKEIKTPKPFKSQRDLKDKRGLWIVEENDLIAESKRNMILKEKPKDVLHCPSCENKHIMGKKDYINLKLYPSKEDPDNKFMCSICENVLASQRVVALKKCGHVFCHKCKEQFCKQEEKCQICNTKFIHSDVIMLESSGTSFCTHNKVVSNIYTPDYRY